LKSYLEEFCDRIRQEGAGAVVNRPVVVDQSGAYRMTYVPFEHVNTRARLVLVSTTPGPTHVQLACELTQYMLAREQAKESILLENKRHAELGGITVRPNLLRMLDHFGIGPLFGVADASALWESAFHLLQPMAVLPYATTKRGVTFGRDFAELLATPMLARTYQSQFLERLALLDPAATFLAIGRCALSALQHAAQSGLVRNEKILGMFPVPIRAGAMVNYFLRQIALEELSANDPVRRRAHWLDAAYAEVSASVERARLMARSNSSLVDRAATPPSQFGRTEELHIDSV